MVHSEQGSGGWQSWWALAGLGWCAAACTQLAPGSDTLREELAPAGVAPGVVPADPKWGCLGKMASPTAVALRPTVAFSLRLIDPSTQAAPAGASARACNRFDIDCATPAAGPVEPASDGLLNLVVPQGFAGFLKITSPAIIPVLYSFSRPLQTDTQDQFIVVGFETAKALAASGSVELDPGLGEIAVRTMDCTGELSGGVEFSNNTGGVPFSFIDGLPTVGYSVSDAAGLGGFVNVPPGTVVLQGQEVSSNQISGIANVVVRAGWFSYGDLNPAPR